MTDPIYVRAAEPMVREVDGEIVMFHPGRGEYFALDEVGSRIWQLLEQPRSMPQLCELLRAEFDVDEATCRDQVRAFVDELSEVRLVETTR